MFLLESVLGWIKLSSLVGLLILVNGCAVNSITPPLPEGMALSERNEYLTKAIDDLLRVEQGDSDPGVSVVVFKDGKIVCQRSKGKALIEGILGESGVQITSETVFDIASVAKPITATAIMQMVERKRLTLKDSVRKWLPYLPSMYEGITIHDLMSHQSGLKDQSTINTLEHKMGLDRVSNRQLIQRYVDDPLLEFTPGSSSQYLNINYVLLAEIIAKSSGVSYARYLHENIFAPLDMRSTYVFGESAPVGVEQALNFGKDTKTYGFTFALTGAMGIYSTTKDLASFSIGLLSGKLVSKDTLRLMTSDQSGSKVGWRVHHYGYGWFVPEETTGLNEFFHPGGIAGYQSMIYIGYEKSFGVVSLSNGGKRTGEIINAIGEIVRRTYVH